MIIFKNKPIQLIEGWWDINGVHGKGRMINDEMEIYEGDFANGKRNGRGVYKWPDGGKYSGYWENGV
jgi:hypothetical protein